jgi:hypothetical protein
VAVACRGQGPAAGSSAAVGHAHAAAAPSSAGQQPQQQRPRVGMGVFVTREDGSFCLGQRWVVGGWSTAPTTRRVRPCALANQRAQYGAPRHRPG